MNSPELPILAELSAEVRSALFSSAQQTTQAPGEVLFYEGDAPAQVWLLETGHVQRSPADGPPETIMAPAWLDPASTFGGLPHSAKFSALAACRCLTWSAEGFFRVPEVAVAARRNLAEQWSATQARLTELAAPLHYQAGNAQLHPGPFLFESARVIFAFCEVAPEAAAATLPPGLRLLQRPLRQTAPLLLALAHFPLAFPEAQPAARFRYTETTYFLPVQHGLGWGLFVPAITPRPGSRSCWGGRFTASPSAWGKQPLTPIR
ncbi:MAG: cyclic nucleotide-binding domain-containing protein [Anaerolineae bacterium]|nr:cyclic nucleotide-binding domain-containing protein [Anaerolineae bacterium]